MNGVEILTSNEIVIAQAFNWSNFWIAIGFTVVLTIIVGIGLGCSCHSGEIGLVASICTMLICILCVAIPLGELTGTPTESETQYKVTIDDSVSMNEFLDKYEIINQEGKIYTVKEK